MPGIGGDVSMVKLIDDTLRVRPTELYAPIDRKWDMPEKNHLKRNFAIFT